MTRLSAVFPFIGCLFFWAMFTWLLIAWARSQWGADVSYTDAGLVAIVPSGALFIISLFNIVSQTNMIHLRKDITSRVAQHVNDITISTGDVVGLASLQYAPVCVKDDLLSLLGRIQKMEHSFTTIESDIKKMSDSVNQHQQDVESASQRVIQSLRLADDLMDVNRKINDALALIPKITSKINLVALNATIEAARAGDAGKGFAVVATEVKSLAMQTFDITKDITTHIGEGNVTADQTCAVLREMIDVMHNAKVIVDQSAQSMLTHMQLVQELKSDLASVKDIKEKIEIGISNYQEAIHKSSESLRRIQIKMEDVSNQNKYLQVSFDHILSQRVGYSS